MEHVLGQPSCGEETMVGTREKYVQQLLGKYKVRGERRWDGGREGGWVGGWEGGRGGRREGRKDGKEGEGRGRRDREKGDREGEVRKGDRGKDKTNSGRGGCNRVNYIKEDVVVKEREEGRGVEGRWREGGGGVEGRWKTSFPAFLLC